jgi:FkbM family methyltransferase
MILKTKLRSAVNRLGGMLGVRVVNRDWGPRGFAAPFKTARNLGFRPGTVFDIGASNGVWTRECRGVFPDASYFMVDPLPVNEPALRDLAAGGGQIRYWRGALGAGDGRLQLNVHGDQSSALAGPDFAGEVVWVEQRTLDSLLAEHDFAGPLLIKADVQGYELEVLRGAEEALARCGMLMLELSVQRLYDGNCLAHEVIAHLGERGFRIFDIASYAQRPKDGLLAQMDVVFAPADSVLFARTGWR